MDAPLESRILLSGTYALTGDLNSDGNSGSDIDHGWVPQAVVQVGSHTFFSATTPEAGHELWKSDGTEQGTVLVKDQLNIAPSLTAHNGDVCFQAYDDATGWEPWKSDGTPEGTGLLKDVATGTSSSFAADFFSHDGALYFSATTPGTGRELWKSAGSINGPTLITAGFNDFGGVFVHDGSLYFAAGTAAQGTELWVSDGTTDGTHILKDLRPGPAGSQPRRFLSHNGLLYFNAVSEAGSPRLWQSDGTPTGTTTLLPSAGQPIAVDPDSLISAGTRLYFAASNNAYGREIFVVDEAATDPPGEAPVITGPSSVTAELRPVISWNPVDRAAEYEIRIKNQSTNTNPFHQATVSGTSYTPDVDFGIGRFNLWIRARNSAGNGPWTSQYNFRINTRSDVEDPGRFLNSHRPTLNWAELPGAVRYDLWIDDKAGGVSPFLRNENLVDTTWTPSADIPLGLYHAWVRGVAADGTAGGWSVTTISGLRPLCVTT